eukprot:350561-Chlamydomonas_euryale.AAC.16
MADRVCWDDARYWNIEGLAGLFNNLCDRQFEAWYDHTCLHGHSKLSAAVMDAQRHGLSTMETHNCRLSCPYDNSGGTRSPGSCNSLGSCIAATFSLAQVPEHTTNLLHISPSFQQRLVTLACVRCSVEQVRSREQHGAQRQVR